MTTNDFQVELPMTVGDGTEFFLQATPPSCGACAAHVHKAVELLYVKSGSYTALLDGVDPEEVFGNKEEDVPAAPAEDAPAAPTDGAGTGEEN